MIKKNKGLAIIGSVIIGVLALFSVYIILISTGVIVAKEYVLVFEAIDKTKDYDGTPLTLLPGDYRIVEGEEYLTKHNHQAVVHFNGNQTDAGSSVATLEVTIFDENGADVSSNYKIVTNEATLTVNPRKLIFKTYTSTKMYDGSSLEANDTNYSFVSGEMVDGEKFSAHVTGKMTEIGSCYVDVTLDISDKYGNPINPNNYEVSYEGDRGEIVVRPRYIFVNTGNIAPRYYNGTEQHLASTTYELSKSELMPGHTIQYVNCDVSGVNVGEYLLDKFVIKVVDGSGNDVSNMYAIDPNSIIGSLIIQPLPITLNTSKFVVEKTYDGKYLDPQNDEQYKNCYEVIGWDAAPSTDKYKVEFNNKLLNAGSIENSATIVITNNKNIDVTSNYDIKTDFGNIVINKREITIKTYSETKPFDTTPIYGEEVLGVDGKNYEISTGSIAKNQKILIVLNSKITDVGKIKNEIASYTITDKEGNNVNDNYLVIPDLGDLEVTKLSIKITTASNTWDYDGTAHSMKTSNDYSVEGLPNDFKIEFYDWPEITDATYNHITNELEPVQNSPRYIIYDKNYNNVFDSSKENSENFSVDSIVWGTLCVKPLNMTITTGDKIKTYDGTICRNEMVESVEGKRDNDRIVYSWNHEFTDVLYDEFGNVTQIENKPEVSVFDRKGFDITKNYIIKWNCGVLRVEPVTIYVTTETVEKTYDGNPINPGTFRITNGHDEEITLPNGDKLTNIHQITDCINVTKVNGVVTGIDNEVSFGIVTKDGKDNLKNYKIASNLEGSQFGKLIIYPIGVIVTTNNYEFTYDGNVHKYNQPGDVKFELSNGNDKQLPSCITYEIINYKEFRDVESGGDNICEVVFSNTLQTAVSMKDNFDVDYRFGKVTINPIYIEVETKNFEKEYDALPIKYEGNDAEWYSITSIHDKDYNDLSLPTGHNISLVKSKEFIDAGEYKNVLELIVSYNGSNVSKNYHFNYTEGNVSIKPISVCLYTPDTLTDPTYIKSKDFDNEDLFSNVIVLTSDDQTKLDAMGVEIVLIDYTKIKDVKLNKSVVQAVDNKLTYKFMLDGKDVSGGFNVTEFFGKLRINQIPLVLESELTRNKVGRLYEKPYDGTEIYDYNIILSDESKARLDGINATLTSTGVYTHFSDVQLGNNNQVKSVANEISYIITIGGNEVKKDNFSILENFGLLRINPIEITLESAITRTKDNKIYFKTYDGTYLYDNEIYVPIETQTILDSMNVNVFADGNTYTKIKDVLRDKSNNVLYTKNEISYAFTMNGNSISNDNFKVTENFGYLRIDPIGLTISTTEYVNFAGGIVKKFYDGEFLFDNQVIADTANQAILDSFNAHIVVTDYNKIKEVEVSNAGDPVAHDNWIKYIVQNNLGDDITTDFNVTVNTGKLMIDIIPITVRTAKTAGAGASKTYEVTYNGEAVYDSEIVLTNEDKTQLAKYNAEVRVIDEGSGFIDVKRISGGIGTYDNDVKVGIFDTITGKEITNIFRVKYDTGKIKINPVNITVRTKKYRENGNIDLYKDYDGIPMYDNEVVFTSADQDKLDSLGATCKVDSYTTVTNVVWNGAHTNAIPVKNDISVIFLINGIDKTDNFNITYATGNFIINPIPVTIKTGSDTWSYDGLEHTNESIELTNGLITLSNAGYTYDLIKTGTYTYISKAETKNNIIGYDFHVYDNDNNDITANIKVTDQYGTLKITNELIRIEVRGAKKEYDGTPLFSAYDDFKFFSSADENILKSKGLTLHVEFIASITEPGSINNAFICHIVDEDGNDYTDNYTIKNVITGEELKLTINTLSIEAQSPSLTKLYDGTPLTCPEDRDLVNKEAFEERLPSGFTYNVKYIGSRTEIGYDYNDFTVTIYDGDGNVVSPKAIEVIYKSGKLEVLPYITGTGNILNQDATPDPDITVFKINASKEGTIYLRDRSYGDYIKTGWDYGKTYRESEYYINGLSLLSKVLEDNNYTNTANVTVKGLSSDYPYLVPYSATQLFTATNRDDTHIGRGNDLSDTYSYSYYLYNYNYENYALLDDDYIAFEDEYYNYVINNYLSIDKTLASTIKGIGATNGIKLEDKSLIYEIAKYIHDTYDYGMAEGRSDANDIVKFFLQTSKKGTCQDFASAAVMMYRAYNIPARYVTGYMYDVSSLEAGKDINIKQTDAHAWVEVYVKGIGWITVEVTKGNKLTVLDGEEVDSEKKGTDANGDLSNNGDEPTGEVLFTINSNQAGTFYLRNKSFGNYNGKGFDEAKAYEGLTYNPLEFVGKTLSQYQTSSMTINLTSGRVKGYLVPYYSVDDLKAYNDIYIDENYGSKYTVNFKNVTIPTDADCPKLAQKNALYSSYETEYRNYVYENYLSMDGASDDLKALFASTGYKKTDLDIVGKVAKYIKNAATYSFIYSIPDDCEDMVYYFLTEGKKGVCQQYAASAVMFYRYLGIPARYTVGYKTTVKGSYVNTPIEVKDGDGHAWVEVYFDNLGWVPVEVTGTMSSGSGDDEKVTITPKSVYVKYSEGMDVVDLTEVTYDSYLTKAGFHVEATISGSSNEIGTYVTQIESFRILDGNDEDVTYLFNVTLKTGTLKIYLERINIVVASDEKEYDGTPLTNHSISSINDEVLANNHHINYSAIKYENPGIITPGSSSNKISGYGSNLILDEHGNDVTSMYYVVVSSGKLTITKPVLNIYASTLYIDEDDFLDLEIEKLYSSEYTYDGLKPGHVISKLEMSDECFVTIDETYVENIIDESSIKILDENGNDITKNYDINLYPGEIEIQ